MKPTFSIVITFFDEFRYVEEALASTFMQEGIECEVHLVNDSLDPESIAFLARLQESYGFKLISQENSGLSRARNVGIEASRGRYLAFLDADDYLLPGVLRRVQDELDRNELDMLKCGTLMQMENEFYFDPHG